LKLSTVLKTVQGILITPYSDLEVEVSYGASADLMSDALRFGRENMLLLTGLTHPQAIRTAEMLGARALLFVRAKIPPPETVALAKEAGIALMATSYTMYEASGLLYQAGLAGLGPCGDLSQETITAV
jgi:hypothetical protein